MIDKIDKAILAELNHWDLSCSEEPTLKIELAKSLGRVVENCFTSDVAEQSKQLVCDCGNPNLTWYGDDDDKTYFCFECKKEVTK